MAAVLLRTPRVPTSAQLPLVAGLSGTSLVSGLSCHAPRACPVLRVGPSRPPVPPVPGSLLGGGPFGGSFRVPLWGSRFSGALGGQPWPLAVYLFYFNTTRKGMIKLTKANDVAKDEHSMPSRNMSEPTD